MKQAVSAAARIATWRQDPLVFVEDVFGVEPDEWQRDALALAGGDPDPSRRICLKACTGPGKTAVLAWLGWHRLACFAAPGEHPKGAALSITADNLKDNLWAELAKWRARSPFLMAAFEWTKEKIYAKDHPETWFLSARSFAKDANPDAIGRALSGLHGKFPFVLLDETGDMPEQVGRAAQQIFTGSPIDALILQAGNPTSTTGLLYESATKPGWDVVTITADPADPKRTPRVSVEHAQEMIDTYGRDNPWVMATILGQFPPTGFSALIGPEEVDEAMARHYTPNQYESQPKILGGDVARQGDDQSAIVLRQGVASFAIKSMRIPDTMLVASQFSMEYDRVQADALFVDETGGYGAGVVDALRTRGYPVIGVQFGGRPNDPRYFDKRSEMLFELVKWIRAGGALAPSAELKQELVALRYVYQGDKFRVVPKDIIKKDIGRSPDLSDALALTFAQPVAAGGRGTRVTGADYDPYAGTTTVGADFDPYRGF